MSALKQFVARNFFSLLYLMLAGSFLMLVAELVWTKHWDGIQLVGLLASGAGAVLALLAWAMGRKARMVLAALFAVLSITGIVGTVEHNEARGGEEASAPVIVAAATGDFAPASAVQLQESDDDATSEAAGDHDDDARERNGDSEGD
ncbi:MAG: hypothetical protein KDD78_02900, partial [Caldilineaceae bacterium]|nr:hypothetical protein [Caldilineaceae bacterium]